MTAPKVRAAAKARPRLKGVEVRAGSVRQARLESGLSLAQVAGREISRAAIHLIETGRSRPSMPTLELIARRTGKPLSYFLGEQRPEPAASSPELHARLTELERLAGNRDWAGVLEQAEEMLEARPGRWDEAHMRHLAGQARVLTGRPQGALAHLRRARALFEDLGDQWMAVDCMDWEAAAMGEDPAALELAREALERCRTLQPVPVDVEARILTRIASKHLQRHEWDDAIEAYDAALEVSRSLRDLDRMATLYDGLSDAYRHRGNLAKAQSFAQKALALHGITRDRTMMARSENNLGVLLVERRRFDEAEEHLRRSLDLCRELRIEGGRGHVLLSLAELEIARGRGGAAARHLQEARDVAATQDEGLTLAFAHQLEGRLAAAEGDPGRADRGYRRALDLMRAARAGDRLVQCHSEYAEALEARGDTEGALAQWREAVAAGRSRRFAAAADLAGGWRPALTG